MRRRILHRILLILIAIDVLLMTTFFGGQRNETISSCAWSMEMAGKWQGKLFRPIIDGIFFVFQKEHCRKAFYAERRKY